MPAATATKEGILLVNLGTPESPAVGDVRRYLAEFLSDPWVIDVNPLGRWLLVHLAILPRRAPQSAAAYAKVWGAEGSPLLAHGRRFEAGVRRALGDRQVELAMRYGRPSIAASLERLSRAGCGRLLVFPLYPQYAESSTRTAVELVRTEAARLDPGLELEFVPAFHSDPGFLDAWAEVARPALDAFEPGHVLFSFHGLPERHVLRTDASGTHCLSSEDCCNAPGEANANCYRAHCFATTRGIATRLALADDVHSISFQSRLGRTPWIRPFTDVVIPELAARGVKRLAVLCPSFVADCLETLEEIGIRARDLFRSSGGDELLLVPSLNDHPAWVEAAVRLVRGSPGDSP